MHVVEESLSSWLGAHEGPDEITPPTTPLPPSACPPRPGSPGLDAFITPAMLALRNSVRQYKMTRIVGPKAADIHKPAHVLRLKHRLLDHNRASAHRMEAELLSQRLSKSCKM